MRHLFILFFLVAVQVAGFAQHDFKPGFIIENSGDTLHGLINLKSNMFNSRLCEFKTNIAGETKNYKPGQIKSYQIPGEKYYVSKVLERKDSTVHVFLEYLLNGVVDLYYLNEKGDDFYYIEKNGEIEELSNHEKIIEEEYGVKSAFKTNQYRGMLTYLFQDAPEVQKSVNSTAFNYKSLIKITEKYHDAVCNDYDCVNYTKSTNRTVYFEPSVGGTVSALSIKTSSDFDFYVFPNVGFNFRFCPVKIQHAWNFLFGANYTQFKFDGEFVNTIDDVERKHHIKLAYGFFSFPFMVEYLFPGDKISPFVSAGIMNNFVVNEHHEIYRIEDYNGFVYETGPVKSNFRIYQFGGVIGGGVRYKLNENSYLKVSGKYGFQMPSSNFGYILDYHRVHSFQLNMAYGFRLN